jgi:redox-sensitive bicupin YhaK (pirin superfamily)
MEKKPRSYKAWSGYDDKTLMDLRSKNVKIRHIAEIMNRTESSIHNRVAVTGIGRKMYASEVYQIKLQPEKKKNWLQRFLGE